MSHNLWKTDIDNIDSIDIDIADIDIPIYINTLILIKRHLSKADSFSSLNPTCCNPEPIYLNKQQKSQSL